ncbi:hypothetical protein ACLK1T_09985 [Escherichia coli]
MDSVGGFAIWQSCQRKNTPSAANISAYADIVRERAVVRGVISVAKIRFPKLVLIRRGVPAKICWNMR